MLLLLKVLFEIRVGLAILLPQLLPGSCELSGEATPFSRLAKTAPCFVLDTPIDWKA
jgi:hypothetical protein